MMYRHIIYFVNGRTLTVENNCEELAFSLWNGFTYVSIKNEITLTKIPATSILYIVSAEMQKEGLK